MAQINWELHSLTLFQPFCINWRWVCSHAMLPSKDISLPNQKKAKNFIFWKKTCCLYFKVITHTPTPLNQPWHVNCNYFHQIWCTNIEISSMALKVTIFGRKMSLLGHFLAISIPAHRIIAKMVGIDLPWLI